MANPDQRLPFSLPWDPFAPVDATGAAAHATDAILQATETVTHATDAVLEEHTQPAAVVRLGTLGDPLVSTGHRLTFTAYGGSTTTVKVELLQGASTVIRSEEFAGTAAWEEKQWDLTTGEADSITNYADLRVRFSGWSITGSPVVQHSWVEWRTPAAAVSTETVTHTADAVLQATEESSHTTDAVLRATEEIDHTADAVLQATEQVGHTTDAVLKATATVANTSDAVLKATEATVHTTDAVLRGTETALHTTDAVVQATEAGGHQTDAVLRATEEIVHTADAVLVARSPKPTLPTLFSRLPRPKLTPQTVIWLTGWIGPTPLMRCFRPPK